MGEIHDLAARRLTARGRSKPPDWRDWDHLHAHLLRENDYFVTLDKGVLCMADELKVWFGICVWKPDELVGLFDGQT